MGPVWAAVHGFVSKCDIPTKEIPVTSTLTLVGEDGKEYVLQRDS